MRFIATILVIFSGFVASAPADDVLQVGVAEVDITPPIPYRMSGYFSERVSTGIKDRLKAKAVVLVQGETKAAIVFCDLIGVSLDVSSRARSVASAATGIPYEHIAIVATHSHTGPLYYGALRKYFHERSIERLGEDPYEQIDYANQLTEYVVQSIEQASLTVRPVSVQAGYAEQLGLSFNRRFHMQDGTVRFNPGQQNPDIVRAAGPIDPQAGVIAFHDPDAESPFAAIISFALHLDTVGGTEYSADYPYWLQQQLQNAWGPHFVSLFGTGTCGDINHIDVRIQGRRSSEEIGRQLGTTVLTAGNLYKPVSAPSLAVRSAIVEVPLQEYSEQQVAAARTNMSKVDSAEVGFLERVETYKIMDLQLRRGNLIPLEVQTFRISPDVAIVTLPGEVFVDLGIAIKAASPFATTLVMELTNDAPGYLPTKKAFAEGSYETINSRIAPGGGEAMVETAVQLLRELAAQ